MRPVPCLMPTREVLLVCALYCCILPAPLPSLTNPLSTLCCASHQLPQNKGIMNLSPFIRQRCQARSLCSADHRASALKIHAAFYAMSTFTLLKRVTRRERKYFVLKGASAPSTILPMLVIF